MYAWGCWFHLMEGVLSMKALAGALPRYPVPMEGAGWPTAPEFMEEDCSRLAWPERGVFQPEPLPPDAWGK